jgi:hypothetical protein
MTSFMFSRRHAAALVLVSGLGILGSWFWTVPGVMSRSTFAFLAVFLLGGAAVSLTAWRNAQATGSTAQLLHATEVAGADHDAPDSSTPR